MKITLLTFLSILILNEVFLLNYEGVIIFGFLLVLYYLIKNIRPIFTNFIEGKRNNISSDINIILNDKINILSKNILLQKNYIIKFLYSQK